MRGRNYRIALAITFALGVAMAIGSLTADLPAKTQAVDNLTNGFRPAFGTAAVAQTTADMVTVQAMSDELVTKTVPALAEALKMTPEQLQGFIGDNFPHVAGGMAQLDKVLPYFGGLVAGIEAHADDFHKADAIPTKNLPATTVTYLFLLPGIVLAVGSVLALFLSTAAARRMLRVTVVIGAVLIIAPIVLSVPGKAQGVDNLTNAFRPAFTAEGAATARTYMDTVQAMSDELQTKMLPALAEALKMTPAQLQGFIGDNFPHVATGVSQLNTILPRFQALVSGIEANVGNFALADSIPTKGTPTTLLHWLFVLPALALVLTGGIGLIVPWWRGSRSPAPLVIYPAGASQ